MMGGFDDDEDDQDLKARIEAVEARLLVLEGEVGALRAGRRPRPRREGPAPWEVLGISRRTYFYRKSRGEL